MSAVIDQPANGGLATEWDRIELLGHCLSLVRQGQELPGHILEKLRILQTEVEQIRQQGQAWQALRTEQLSVIEYDVLACVVGSEAEPRLGWTFQNLQPGSPQPYPSAALIQDLLAMDAISANQLYEALSSKGNLQQQQLIQIDGEDPYQPIRPGSGVTARLLGRALSDKAPPGAVGVETNACWDDLILPPDRLLMLREFLWWIQHRDTVVDQWGGSAIGGPVALFSGPSGTGKTFAGRVIAAELGWPLYRVDLGRLVSKYIGETEKNLNRLFDATNNRPLVLQFDEADALFSKRGEVKEARDRYANMEVSHLLARIESHQGPCILTTNLRKNLDPAFARRFQVVVDFPRPDADARIKLWQRLIPPGAPRTKDVDPEFLGRSISITGGNIRNAALHAAYLAAGSDTSLSMQHLALAVWRELGKDGRELSCADLGPVARFLPEYMGC